MSGAVSGAASVDRAYAAFLGSADTATWEACTEQAVAAARSLPGADDRADAFTKSLCITAYLVWLSRVSGDLPRQKRATATLAALREEVLRLEPGPAGRLSLSLGMLLAATGYRGHAAELLRGQEQQAPEYVPWLLFRLGVRELPALQRVAAGPAASGFLPLRLEYGTALVNVGMVGEACSLAAASGHDASHPLMLEVLGSARERLGQWAEAYQAYRASDWPEHRYRAAMTGAIAGVADAAGDLSMDEPMRQYLGQLEGEMTASDLARCVAFLNACLWQQMDDWRIELELGKLSHRRRQYSEANLHLTRAVRAAPAPARFAIDSLRFGTLTWLTGLDVPQSPDMMPEALTAGADALSRAGPEDDTTWIRTWMARATGNHVLIPAALDDWPAHARADALRAVGEPAQAVEWLLTALESGYIQRSAGDLARCLHAAGLTGAVGYLAELVLRESAGNFTELWELAVTLRELPPGESTGNDPYAAWHDRFLAELIQLSQFDFVNSVRSHVLAVAADRPDLAEEMLRRATRQADGVSELQTVAVLRRQPPLTERGVAEGHRCLKRALGQVSDRFERLQIAAELARYGDVREARAILAEEGVAAGTTVLTHAEAAVALACGSALSAAERAGLAARAAQQLNADQLSGALGGYAGRYGRRLLEVLRDPGGPHSAETGKLLRREFLGADPGGHWPGAKADGGWAAIENRVRLFLSPLDQPNPDDRPERLGPWLEQLPDMASFGGRVVVAARLREHLADLRDQVRRAVPEVDADRVPVAKASGLDDGQRIIQLCDLWRSRLTAPADQAADHAERLGEFFANERVLLRDWEDKRRQASAPALERVAAAAQALDETLARLLGPQQRAARHPVLRGLFDQIARDVQARRDELADQIAAARTALGTGGTGIRGDE